MQKPLPPPSLDLVFHPAHDSAYVHFENGEHHPFDPAPNGLPRLNAWWLADAALLTYWPPSAASAIFQRAGLESEFIEAGTTQCYLAWQPQWLVAAFRGTEPDQWGDVFDDLKFAQVPWRAGRVHGGFKGALDRIWPRLSARLQHLSAGRTIWFAGHSLGAALATLAADLFPDARGVCTLGSPRVGDETFAAAFDLKFGHRSLRYVHDSDVVTHAPPPLVFLDRFQHVGLRRFIDQAGAISGGEPVIPHFFADLIGDGLHVLEMIKGLNTGALTHPPKFLLDHMPRAYAVTIWNDFDRNG